MISLSDFYDKLIVTLKYKKGVKNMTTKLASNKRLNFRFISFVMTNGMNTFPILILSQFFLQHKRLETFVLPLIMFYCFKTTTLFLIRLKPVSMPFLLKASLTFGLVGCSLGVLSDLLASSNMVLILAIFAGICLGICSGTLMPSYFTIQFHEKTLNNFGSSAKDQVRSLAYAIVLLSLLITFSHHSLVAAFLFLGLNLVALSIVLTAYPSYHLTDDTPYPTYSLIETLFLFIVGFFSIFILKSAKKIDMGDLIFPLLVFLILIAALYLLYVLFLKKDRKLPLSLTGVIIFKGMLTNYIFVFCTFYQLLYRGPYAFYAVYIVYLIATIVAPFVTKLMTKNFPSLSTRTFLIRLFIVSFLLLANHFSFFAGVFLLSLASAQLNHHLNVISYHLPILPQDYRLIAKYRLNNIGSILQQIIVFFTLYMVTIWLNSLSFTQMLQDYSTKTVNTETLFPLVVTNLILLGLFTLFIPIINQSFKNPQDFH